MFNEWRLTRRISPSVVVIVVPWLSLATSAAGVARVDPAPVGEQLSAQFKVVADGNDVPVYNAKVPSADATLRWKSVDDVAHSGQYFDLCSFASFDMAAPATVRVTCPQRVHAVAVLPTSAQVAAKILPEDPNSFTFTVERPRELTIEINGDQAHSLHLFANPLEADPPRPDDPNVVYYGPGIHEIREGLRIGDNKTLYLAGGAILRGVEPGGPVVELAGSHITLRGRGIIDGSGCPIHSRNLLMVRGQDIRVEGIILRDSSTWTMPIRQSDRVTVSNIKVFGCRANSDGIDICNSRDVTVDGCFLRTLDDLVVVKSDASQGEVHRVVVKNCVLWNAVAHALSIGAELRENVDDVSFEDCDVIRDTCREWTLRVFHCDSAVISHVRFQNVRVEQSRRLISLWIGKFVWTRDPERGHIRDVTFANISAVGDPLQIELQGFDVSHAIENVDFDHVTLNGRGMTLQDIRPNQFARDVGVR